MVVSTPPQRAPADSDSPARAPRLEDFAPSPGELLWAISLAPQRAPAESGSTARAPRLEDFTPFPGELLRAISFPPRATVLPLPRKSETVSLSESKAGKSVELEAGMVA